MALRETIQRSEVRRHALALADLAATLEHVEDYTTSTAASFCTLIRKTAEFLENKTPAAPEDKLLHIEALLQNLGEHLRYPERSRIDQTPWSIVQSIENFLQSHVGSDVNFIIRPQWKYNYSIIGEFVKYYRTLLSSLGSWSQIQEWEVQIGAIASQSIFCISFPRVERLNVLMHVNWGHEVGHILAGKWIDTHFGSLWHGASPSIEAALRSHLTSQSPPASTFPAVTIAKQVALLMKETMDLAQASFKEIISDCIGAHLFGPAALACLAEFSSRVELDESPITCNGYPPWRYRLRMVLESVLPSIDTLSSTNCSPILFGFCEWLKEWKSITAATSDAVIIGSDIRSKEAYNLVETHWPTIKQQVIQQLPQFAQDPYSLRQRLGVVEESIQRIEHNVPPNEVGDWPKLSPTPLADIWNAAWACKTYQFTRLNTDEFVAYSENLFRLALKAIEASYVHTTFAQQLP
jgi:hypothetical protein